MNWILEHLQLIIVIAGAIAYWINQNAREKAGQDADYDGDGIPDNRPGSRTEARELRPDSRDGSNPEQDERVRRIQEEIRRKIAERRGQAAPPPMPAPRLDPFRPVFQEEPVPRTPPPLREPEPVAPPPLPRETVVAYDDSAALERQRRLAEQMEQLEARRRETRRAAQEISAFAERPAAGAGTMTAATPGAGERRLGAELRDPRALRRAFVMREVLDAPVALR